MIARLRARPLLASLWLLAVPAALAVEPATQALRPSFARLGAAALPAEHEAQRQALLQQARVALGQGEPAAAHRALDAAAAMLHAADTEMLVVQAQLQAGEVRTGLSFAAHAAGAHPQQPRATALYVWLLALSGQPAFALRQLDAALALHPDDASLRGLREAVVALRLRPASQPAGSTVHAVGLVPLSMEVPGPLPSGAAVPLNARPGGTGVLIDGGRLALVPWDASAAASALWLRNGLGQARAARVVRTLPGSGLALLELSAALPVANALASASRDAFPGSPGSLVGFLPQTDASARWPLLAQGFVGGLRDGQSMRDLGIDVPEGMDSGPLFDAAGRWLGLALPDATGVAGWLPVSALQEALGDAAPMPRGTGLSAAPRISPEQAYETAVQHSVQVLRLP